MKVKDLLVMQKKIVEQNIQIVETSLDTKATKIELEELKIELLKQIINEYEISYNKISAAQKEQSTRIAIYITLFTLLYSLGSGFLANHLDFANEVRLNAFQLVINSNYKDLDEKYAKLAKSFEGHLKNNDHK